MMFVPLDTSYSFIKYDSNHLILPADSSQMRRFAEKWYRLLVTGEGHINIVQMGASHVQGGTLPHRVRYNLLTPLPNLVAARGMIFPYSAASKCNNPYDYKISRSRPLDLTRCVYKEPLERLGLCGIAVTAANEPADIGITLNEPEINFSSNTVILFGEARGGVEPYLTITDRNGDSLAVKAVTIDTALRRYSFEMPFAVDSFHIVIPCTDNQSFAITGVYLDNGAPGISYHSIGVNGASLVEYNTRCPYFSTDLQMLKPDLVIFGIGINDASGPNFDTVVFQRRYMQLIDSIRSVSPDCAFLFITNNDSFRRVKRSYIVNDNGPLAREAFIRLGQITGGAVWDQFTVMGGLGSMGIWQNNDLAQRDHIHFTRKGYQILADLMCNALFETLVQLKPAAFAKQHHGHKGTQGERHLYKKRTKNNNNNRNTNKEDERFNYISY
ncbi:MAG: hypothetical protein J6031_07415 [Bacteroidales bacterium]|nr:hypothetical protein [Bacteroidales bacterium]